MNYKPTSKRILGASVLFIILTILINFLALIPMIYLIMSEVDSEPLSDITKLLIITTSFIFATYATYFNMKLFVRLLKMNDNWRFAQYIFWVYVITSTLLLTLFLILKKIYLLDIDSLVLFSPWHTFGGYLNNPVVFFLQDKYLEYEINFGVILIISAVTTIFSLLFIYHLLHRKFNKGVDE